VRDTLDAWGRIGRFTCLVLVVSSLVACQSSTRLGDRYYANGRYAAAAAAYQVYLEADSTDKEQTTRMLFRLGVIYGTPGSSVYDPERSLEILDQLIDGYPGSPYNLEAVLLRNLQLSIQDLERELTADQVRLTELQVDLAQRESELADLGVQVDERDAQIVTLQESIPPLRIEIRELIHELASKQEELEQLERLKEIDLDQAPP